MLALGVKSYILKAKHTLEDIVSHVVTFVEEHNENVIKENIRSMIYL